MDISQSSIRIRFLSLRSTGAEWGRGIPEGEQRRDRRDATRSILILCNKQRAWVAAAVMQLVHGEKTEPAGIFDPTSSSFAAP